MHTQGMRSRSQESRPQHDLDMACIQKRLEDELRQITNDRSQPHPMQRCILLLMDVGNTKDSLMELKERIKTVDLLKVEMKIMVDRICKEYQNCMNELRYRLSLTEDDLALANERLAAISRNNELLELKESEVRQLQQRISELEVQLSHQREQSRAKEQSLALSKAISDKEVYELNLKLNEILEIVHEKNSRIDELQSDLRTLSMEIAYQKQSTELLACSGPIELSSIILQAQKGIEQIDVLGVRDCGAKTLKPGRLPSPLKAEDESIPVKVIPSPIATVKETPMNGEKQRKRSQPHLKQIDSELMNRMQMFISEMTASHRSKMKKMERHSIIATFRSPKRPATKQQWFGRQRRAPQVPTAGSMSSRQ